MSVINQPDPLPNRMWVIVRYLQGRAPVSNDELVGALSPPNLRGGKDPKPQMLQSVLSEARRLGLVNSNDGRWELTTDVKDEDALLAYLESALLDPARIEASRQELVPRALAWFLTQNPAQPLPLSENWRTMVIRECPDASGHAFELINDTRQRQLAYWASYLGYAWRLTKAGTELLLPDPAVALERHLKTILAPGASMPAPEFFDRMAERCSVLEGGVFRREVEEMLISRRRRASGELSRSTSLALARLEARGVIEMPRPLADSTPLILDLWPERRPVTHIALRGGG